MVEAPYSDVRREALAALADGEPQRAFALFRWTLEYPSALGSTEAWQDALTIFAQICAAMDGDEIVPPALEVARDPDDAAALLGLGIQLIEHSLHGIAATVLTRAHALTPGREQILTELVGALSGSQYHHDACRVLREAGAVIDESFPCRYLLAFNALMTGDIEEPRRLLSALEAMTLAYAGPNNSFLFMVGQLRQMLERAAALSRVSVLDEQDLRGWHFIVNGGLLLHLSPYGFNEGMNGRYAYTHDSEARCLMGICRLQAVLAAWDAAPPRVYVLPHRESGALAHAAAGVLGLPVEPWPEGGSEAPGLIVVYDLDALSGDLLQTLYPHRPGQMLFCHAACWTAEPPFVADVTTYLYQVNKTPWDMGTRPKGDGEPEEPLGEAKVEVDVEELGAKIASAALPEGTLEDLPALIEVAAAMAKATGEAAAGAFRGEGNRRRQRKDSPVKSSHF
jgi:hypothetical protein